MTSIKDIISGLFSTTQERIKNPFISSFAIAWFVSNWKATFIILFSKTSIENRIELVTLDKYCSVTNLIWIPLCVSIFYILLLPYVMLSFDFLSSFGREGRKKRSEDEIYRGLERKTRFLKKEFKNEQIRAGNQELVELNDKIKLLQNSLNDKSIELENSHKILEQNNDKDIKVVKELNAKLKLIDNLTIELDSIKSENEIEKKEKSKFEAEFQNASIELKSINEKLAKLNSEKEYLGEKLKEQKVQKDNLIEKLGAEKNIYINESKINEEFKKHIQTLQIRNQELEDKLEMELVINKDKPA